MTGFDAVQLSYDEPRAATLHTRLERALDRRVKRLHGVHGMRRAYRLTAELVDTEMFFLADGDFEIDLRFDAAVEPLADGVAMRVWQAVNPVNGLTYGYGGLKLIRRTALREMGEAVDVLAALPGRVEFCPRPAGVTRFNQSPYLAWKAGFRECAMLAHGSEYGMNDQSAQTRINAWTASSGGEFAAQAAAGARDGIAFAREAARSPEEFELLNDPVRLRAHHARLYPFEAVTS
ncbi:MULTISPECIES: hypothetical protein [unclassified Streptomyces]|uniref:hypothetical protein n=1 Tax=unclassified Streptomyces TaxID=2593676 RepID=UPI00166117EB|nr:MULTISPECIES: hypothetical protein [unclassified Streptomyces]MBD0708999.1 hypothetical protein [Streptomyces sp. CBMA291]MBD0716678.1 hypothetical protein [Streptomyces sp. CBMA370]